MKLKKGDHVLIIAGKDKGKKGKIVKVFPKINKIVVEGVNILKKNQRPKRSNEKGQVISLAMPINVSNAMVIDPKTGKGSRVGSKKVGEKKIRIARKSNQEI